MSLDGHTVLTPVFIQPGSDIECLLGTNVLPQLGVKFLRRNGQALLPDLQLPAKQIELKYSKSSPVSDDVSRIQQDKTKGCSFSSKCELLAEIQAVESHACIIRSTYLPNWCTTV